VVGQKVKQSKIITQSEIQNLEELKNSGPDPRLFIYRGKNEPPTVIGFCMRNDLDATLIKLKGKYMLIRNIRI